MKTLVKEEVDQIRNILSPEQLPKVKAILEERKEAKEESLAQSIASLKDLDLTEAEVAKIGEIRNEYRAKFEGAVKQLGGLLSDTQKTAREEAIKADKSRREILQVLNLSRRKGPNSGTSPRSSRTSLAMRRRRSKGCLPLGKRRRCRT